MLDNKGFDLWADGYDKTVGVICHKEWSLVAILLAVLIPLGII